MISIVRRGKHMFQVRKQIIEQFHLSSLKNKIHFLFFLGFVRVVQVFVPFSLTLGCLALATAFVGFVSRRSSITSVLIGALLAFLSCELCITTQRTDNIPLLFLLFLLTSYVCNNSSYRFCNGISCFR